MILQPGGFQVGSLEPWDPEQGAGRGSGEQLGGRAEEFAPINHSSSIFMALKLIF